MRAPNRPTRLALLTVAVIASATTALVASAGPAPAVPGQGPLDPTFGTGGAVVTTFGDPDAPEDTLTDLLVQPDGTVLAVGSTRGAGFATDAAVVRYTSAGAIDTAFATSGKLRVQFGTAGSSSTAMGVVRQADGKLVVVGRLLSGGGVDVAVARFNADGTPDASYGTSGRTVTDVGTTNDLVSGVAIDASGRVLVVGTAGLGTSGQMFVLRYTAAGVLDATFGTGGQILQTVTAGAVHSFGGVVVQPDGKVVVAGSTFGAGSQSFVFRFDDDGTPDASFDSDGVAAVGAGSMASPVLQSDGKIVVAGYDGSPTNHVALARLTTAGALDPTFDGDGRVVSSYGVASGSDLAADLAVQPDGHLVVVGAVQSTSGTLTDFAIARFESDGRLDTSFGTDGRATSTVVTDWQFESATEVAVQPDGRIISAGTASLGSNLRKWVLLRYEPGYRGLTSVAPVRLLDTRLGGVRPAANSITRVSTGAPAGTRSVLVNLTMTDAVLPGYITADACSALVAGPQTKSNGNYAVGVNVANSAVVPIDADGAFCIYTERSVHLLADLQGFFGNNGNRLTTATPTRVLDTRAMPVRPAGSITRVNTGAPGGTAAVLVNLTMTQAEQPGYITADACSALVAGPQTKSNGNVEIDIDIANSAVVSVDPDGAFCIYNEQPLHLLVDLQGTYRPVAGRNVTAVAPTRVLDTRLGDLPVAEQITRVESGAPAGTTAVLVNLTMTDAEDAGFITADSCLSLLATGPTFSNGNYRPGRTSANTAVVNLDPDGSFCIYNFAPVDLLADVQAVYR